MTQRIGVMAACNARGRTRGAKITRDIGIRGLTSTLLRVYGGA